jgi:hypothetical protein
MLQYLNLWLGLLGTMQHMLVFCLVGLTLLKLATAACCSVWVYDLFKF